MTDEHILETIKRIKIYCHRRHLNPNFWEDPCQYCVFCIKHKSKRGNVCQLTQLIGSMTCEPRLWNLPRLEEIIKGETDESHIDS